MGPLRGYPRGITWIALPACVGKSEDLVMPRTEWHGEVIYWGKVQPNLCMHEKRPLNRQ